MSVQGRGGCRAHGVGSVLVKLSWWSPSLPDKDGLGGLSGGRVLVKFRRIFSSG